MGEINQKRRKVYGEIKSMLGIVPSFFNSIPDSSIEDEWRLMKLSQFDSGPIPNKYRELMGLAIAAVTRCKYCAFFHTEAAKMNGATEAELEDAVHFAKSSAGWSAYLNGMQVDFEQFKKEVREIAKHAKENSN